MTTQMIAGLGPDTLGNARLHVARPNKGDQGFYSMEFGPHVVSVSALYSKSYRRYHVYANIVSREKWEHGVTEGFTLFTGPKFRTAGPNVARYNQKSFDSFAETVRQVFRNVLGSVEYDYTTEEGAKRLLEATHHAMDAQFAATNAGVILKGYFDA